MCVIGFKKLEETNTRMHFQWVPQMCQIDFPMQGWESVCRGVLGITLLENKNRGFLFSWFSVSWFLGCWFLGFVFFGFLVSKSLSSKDSKTL